MPPWPGFGRNSVPSSQASSNSWKSDAQYAGYLDRQDADVIAFRRDEARVLPGGLDYGAVAGLSNEVRAKLEVICPATLGQAARIEGVTAAALTLVLAHVKSLKNSEKPMQYGPEAFQAATSVSRETLARLQAYADLLTEWNARHNLVAKSTLSDLWQRHMLDSAQLAALIPDKAKTLADLGSGAGFPGLVLAILSPDLSVTLHEATTKKCAFLSAVAERVGISVKIENARMEDLPPRAFDVVTARACAPLPQLLAYAHPFTGPDSVALFLKGQNVGSELTAAHKYWKMKASQSPSQTDPSAAIVAVRELGPRNVASTKTGQKTANSGRRQSKGRRR